LTKIFELIYSETYRWTDIHRH